MFVSDFPRTERELIVVANHVRDRFDHLPSREFLNLFPLQAILRVAVYI